jgi:hypothetical protein
MPRLPTKLHRTNSRAFHTRYKEYKQAVRNNNSNSECSDHILNTGCKYGTIRDMMNVIRTTFKHTGKIPNIQDQQKYLEMIDKH